MKLDKIGTSPAVTVPKDALLAIKSREELPAIAKAEMDKLSLKSENWSPKSTAEAAQAAADVFTADRLSRYFAELSEQLTNYGFSLGSRLRGSFFTSLGQLKEQIKSWVKDAKASGGLLPEFRQELVKSGIPLDAVTSENFTNFLHSVVDPASVR